MNREDIVIGESYMHAPKGHSREEVRVEALEARVKLRVRGKRESYHAGVITDIFSVHAKDIICHVRDYPRWEKAWRDERTAAYAKIVKERQDERDLEAAQWQNIKELCEKAGIESGKEGCSYHRQSQRFLVSNDVLQDLLTVFVKHSDDSPLDALID